MQSKFITACNTPPEPFTKSQDPDNGIYATLLRQAKRNTRGAWVSLFGMNQVKSLDRAVWEPKRAVHYLSGDYMLRSGHKAGTHAARLGSSVTDNQSTSFFIPKRDTHTPLQLLSYDEF